MQHCATELDAMKLTAMYIYVIALRSVNNFATQCSALKCNAAHFHAIFKQHCVSMDNFGTS